jgi:hypothetical protein
MPRVSGTAFPSLCAYLIVLRPQEVEMVPREPPLDELDYRSSEGGVLFFKQNVSLAFLQPVAERLESKW